VATQPQRLRALFLPIGREPGGNQYLSPASHSPSNMAWGGGAPFSGDGADVVCMVGGGGCARSREGVSTATSASVSVGDSSRHQAGAQMLSLVCLRAWAKSENELLSGSIGAQITAVRKGRPDKRRRRSLETPLLARVDI